MSEVLKDSLGKFDDLVAHPENYLSVQDSLSSSVKQLTKSLYDFSKKEERKVKNNTSLPELIIQDFDEEQIWQEIELQNEDRWTHTLANVSKLLTNKNNLEIPITIKDESNGVESDITESEDENVKISAQKKDEKLNLKKPIKRKITKPKTKKTIVDDKFFKLREMEEFLDAEDKAEMVKEKRARKKSKKESSDEEDDDEIDLFEGWESDKDEEESDEDDKMNPVNTKYDDFFDKASSDDEDNEDDTAENYNKDEEYDERLNEVNSLENELQSDDDSEIDLKDNKTSTKKRVSFNIPQQPSSDDESDANIDGSVADENDVENDSNKNLSEFELRQQRLRKKISHLENALLEEKSWTMKGEVDAASRPQNSLLEEVVDFDITSRPPPVITEETTIKLQDVIIQRIKDKAWDDVERKAKAVQEIPEFKKQIVLDQEKSKLSLAQVYEQEYIKQREALDPNADEKPEEEPPEHIEIRKLMSGLFEKLNALSNFHYTPKIAVPEVKIVSNIPAISMEEIAPVATSDATLLAPEEIKRKPKGDIIGKSERSETDQKRERRKKKVLQRERQKEKKKREKLVEKLRPGLGNKYSKEKMTKLLDNVTKDRNVDKMEVTNDKKSLNSSSAFFEQLQDEVSKSIKLKMKEKFKNKRYNQKSAKQLKL